jgi:WhiB family transcriptional regulator, redox-sensing transcriptional regulator
VLDVATADRSWQMKGLCRGNHSFLFFPPSHAERKEERERREHKAKAICSVCPVAEECLEFAVEIREPYGIWGGYTETERRHMVSKRGVSV